MDCPRCGAASDDRPECPRCGVLVAKAAAALARRPTAAATPASAAAPRAPTAGAGRSVPSRLLPLLLAAAGLLFAVAWLRPTRDRPRPPVPPAADAGPLAFARQAAEPSPATGEPGRNARDEPHPQALQPQSRQLPSRPSGDFVGTEAGPEAIALAAKVRGSAPVDAADLALAERLHAKDPGAVTLLQAVLAVAAQQERGAHRYAAACELLQRAVAADPSARAPREALLAVQVEAGDWPAAERSALELQQLRLADANTIGTLAYALVRQDRSREAIELLTRELEKRSSPELASLLARLQRDSGVETNLRQQSLAHFHVRYDGEAHEDVGRELLRVLDRHYATLARTFDHEPSAPIAVVLLSREAYYDGTGAPAWSGGRYDSFDGRVRIPIGGLTTSLTPDLDATALHELTHAFVAERSGGLAPRELHEGLAQMMEGRRLSSLGETALRALASGRADGVGGYYLGALAFAEDLVALRGQGGINDVLSAMPRTGSVDAAFREVYGRDYQAALSDAGERLRARYGR